LNNVPDWLCKYRELKMEASASTTMEDLGGLCANLLAALENAVRVIYREDGTQHISTAYPVMDRARIALQQASAVQRQPTPKRHGNGKGKGAEVCQG
jgi:hypothetical protein